MLLTKRLACPSCDAKLKVADTLPAGKLITCPKCGTEFPVPGGNSRTQALEEPAPKRKAAPPPDEDEEEQASEPRPRPRKRSKKPKQTSSNTPLVLGLVIGGAVALIAAAALLLAVRPWEKNTERVAESGPSRPAAMEPRPGPRPAFPGPMGRRPGGGEPGAESGPGPAPQQPVVAPAPSRQSSAGTETDLVAAGQGVYQANNCGRCHGMGGNAGGGRRGPRGPDLARVGASPAHTVDWLMEQIRNPQSHKPDSRMPAYADKISEEDLRALATYLASLK